jgi:4-diphosphocytidyl-2-C-methyl-D-erythritol kinase
MLPEAHRLIQIKSPAKINLFLAVKGKRADGYHEIITLLCRIRLFDALSIRFGFKDHAVSCSAPNVPEDETNLAYRAAVVFFKNLPGPKQHLHMGVRISIEKKIPVGAGLGGGSSNAASVLMGLNRFYGSVFSKNQLMQMGLSLGADVPFFIFKKPALAQGIGEKLSAFHRLPPYQILLVYPGKSVSTQEVYKNLNLGLTKCEQKLNCLLFKKEAFTGEKHLCNDLETVAESSCPEIGSIKKQLIFHGAEGAMMTGSGSAVFGLFVDFDKAGKAFDVLSKVEGWEVFLTELMA